MKLQELVDGAREAVPALKDIPEKKALALLRHVFGQVRQQLAGTDEGEVEVQGLGKFRIAQVEKKKDGEKVVRKRVAFAAGKIKEGKKAKEKKAAKKAKAEGA